MRQGQSGEAPLTKNAGTHAALTLQFVKYFLVAVVALLVDTGMLSVAVRILALPLPLAVGIAFLMGACVNYWLSIKWVFDWRRFKGNGGLLELSVCWLIGAVGLMLTQAVMQIGFLWLGLNLEFVKFFAAGLTFVFNFSVRKMLLF